MEEITNDTWHCSRCTFANIFADSKCKMCFNLRKQSTNWNCSYCTYLNVKHENICQMCFKTRTKSGTSSSQNQKSILKHTTADTFKTTTKCQQCKTSTSNGKSICAQCEQSSVGLINSTSNSSQTLSIPALSVKVRQKNDETDGERTFAQIIKYCRTNNYHFVDDSFPPIPRSIGYENFDTNVQWLRRHDIAPNSREDAKLAWSVMLADPNPSDIQQGQLGDCWLMAALSLITERPEMLQYIVLTKEVNNEGIYLVRICKNGQWVTVMIDDCFPCTSWKVLAFTQAKRRQLYVPLIEKACAKIFGSYSELIGGQTSEGLQLFTGAPCDHFYLENNRLARHGSEEQMDPDVLWAKLLSACEINLLIGASTGRTDVSRDEYANVKIHSNHAFSILKVYSLSRDERFILVRDPHSNTRYEDEHVTRDTLNLLQNIQKSQPTSGSFWISWPSFLRYFSTITICRWQPDMFDVRLDGQFTTNASQSINAYYFHLDTTSQINISLIHHKKDRKQHTRHTQTFLLCDIDYKTRNIGAITAIIRSRRSGFTYWDGLLRNGSYILIPFSTSFWSDRVHKTSLKYTIVIHSSNSIDLTVVDSEPMTSLSDCLVAAVMKNGEVSNRVHNCKYYTLKDNSLDCIIFVVENGSDNYYLNVNTDMEQPKNVQSSRQMFLTVDLLPPRTRQIIFMIEWNTESNESVHLSYSYNARHTRQQINVIPRLEKTDFHQPRPIF